jgi:uncharacterized repeat protein (TIGR01451 family)
MALAGATSAAGPRPAKANTHAGWAIIKQHGKRNYAGPNCPGKGWTCTTSTRVLQAAAPGGQNVAECVGAGAVSTGTLTNPICNITQTGSSNVARCTQKSADPSSIQSCVIVQTGASNNATVAQTISSTTTGSQAGTQTAAVTQSGATVSNIVKLTQSVSQSTKGTGAQTQEAHQKANVDQTVAGAGTNLSNVTQSQLQKAMGGSPQNQNAVGASVADCLNGSPANPNACADINQHSGSGTNTNYLSQSIDQDANTAVSNASQTQGSSGGGLEGHVHQDTISGSSYDKAKQDKHQKANGPANASQTQYDPVRCCGTASQFGGSGNVEDINQSSSIGASNPNADQHSLLIGESRNPDGTCIISQHAALDDDSANNSETLSPCPLLIVQSSCSSQSTDLQAAARGDDNCFASQPQVGQVESSLDKRVRNNSNEDETYADATTAETDDILGFKITYTNAGDIDAHSVTVSDALPAGLSFDSCDQEPIPCSVEGNTISWDVGSVPFGQSVDLFFIADVTRATDGTITNTADAASKEEGSGAASDGATVNVVNPPPAPISLLSLRVRNVTDNTAYSSTGGAADPGDILQYEVVYSNSGGPAHNVSVGGFGDIPDGTTLIDAIPIPTDPFLTSFICPQNLSVTTCTLGFPAGTVASDTLAVFRTATFTVSANVPCDSITFSASGNTTEDVPPPPLTSNSTTVFVSSGTPTACIG